MAQHGAELPQLSGELFLTDGGIETTLIFHEGLELPHFAAFDLLKHDEGRRALERYFTTYADIAARHGLGFIFESATWRASPDWGRKLGYGDDALKAANRDAIELVRELRDASQNEASRIVISGCIGPRGDGYNPGELMSAEQAEEYHATQAEIFSDTAADMITAITMT